MNLEPDHKNLINRRSNSLQRVNKFNKNNILDPNNIRTYKEFEDASKNQIYLIEIDRIITGFILFFIYFLIALEEVDWLIYSANKDEKVEIQDQSFWNINNILNKSID